MHDDSTIAALAEQVGCYQRLAKLAEIQHEHVQQSRTEELLEVLGWRQKVLGEVNRLEGLIRPAKSRWADYLTGLDEAQRSRAEALMAESRRLLEQITAADQQDALVLQQRKLNLGRQIGQAAAARQVNRSYAAAAYGSAPARMDVQR